MMCKRPTNVGFYGQSLSCSWTLLSLLLYSHWLLHILVEKALIETLTLPLKPENIKRRWAPVYEAISSPLRPTATSSLSHPISRLSSAVLSKWGHENEQKHNLQKKKKKYVVGVLSRHDFIWRKKQNCSLQRDCNYLQSVYRAQMKEGK